MHGIVWSEMHEQLKCILKKEDYKNYVSIEMENLKNINLIKKILLQVLQLTVLNILTKTTILFLILPIEISSLVLIFLM